jgi:hypothetical protein
MFIAHEPHTPSRQERRKGERAVDLVLDLDQRVQDHRAAGVHVDFIGVERGILAVVRRPAIDLERLDVLGSRRRLVGFADADLGIGGQSELSHRFLLKLSCVP